MPGESVTPAEIVLVGCLDSGLELAERLVAAGLVFSHILSIHPDHPSVPQISGYRDYTAFAERHGIPIRYAREYGLTDEADLEFFRSHRFDLLIQGGWQRLFPREMLDALRIGAIGVHGSADFLPKGRGRSPMNWSIVEGRERFVLSLFIMDPGVDDGSVFDYETYDITGHDTIKTLYYKSVLATERMILRNLPALLDGSIVPVPQSGTPTYYPKRSPLDGRVDWELLDVHEVHRAIRAQTRPYPGAYAEVDGSWMRLWSAQVFDTRLMFPGSAYGAIVARFGDDLVINCRGGLLLVTDAEPVDATEFAASRNRAVMRRAVYPMLHLLQRGIARFSRFVHRGRDAGRPVSWVVGTVEIASMVANFARAVPDSYSVMLAPNRFYDFSYDFEIRPGRGAWLRYWFVAPWEFGRLAAIARGFVYVGAVGFLVDSVDDRAWEFAFLRRHGVHVACLFTGNDIRSPALMRRFQDETGVETIATYLGQVWPYSMTAAFDDQRRRTAAVADRHASVIFNAAVDQLSYLGRPTEPFPYFFPDGDLLPDPAKHETPGARIVVHAPSSPIIKGTQVVRAAVQRLRAEGHDFEYRELIDVPHSEVMAALREAHIVLNEFYAFVPGVFGVEAMGSGCALLTRADETIETDLPAGSNDAWVVTPAADIYENLRLLLAEPERIAPQAAAGLAWVREHATVSASGARIRGVLDSLVR